MGWKTNSRWALTLLLALSILAGVGCLSRSVKASSESDVSEISRKAYGEKTLTTYDNRFGVKHPFLPSNAAIENVTWHVHDVQMVSTNSANAPVKSREAL
jgi:hypothetical protein